MKSLAYVVSMGSLIVLAGANINPARAQPVDLSMGARVRITAPSVQDRKIIGIVVGVSDSVFTIATEKSGIPIEIPVPVSFVERLEVSRGKKSGIEAALITGAASGLVGWIAAQSMLDDKISPSSCLFLFCFQNTMLLTRKDAPEIGIATGIMGALIGYGLTQGKDRWEEVPRRLSVGLTGNPLKEHSLNPIVTLRWPINGL